MEKPFVIYRSSAGSGKTYTLALEYLKLALRNPTAYRSILAVTFTNKATQEMKSRIIQYLYEVAKVDDSSLKKSLAESLSKAELELSLDAEKVLQSVLHGYSYFSVMTIDAFFQKVVRGFAREMGLQAGFSIELDQGKVLDKVIDQMLLELGDPQQRTLRRWLTRFAEEKVEAGNSWDFRREIKELAKELFKENYWEKRNLRTQALVNPRDTADLLKQLRELQTAFEQHMAEIGQKALAQLEQSKASVEDFAYGKNGVTGYFTKIATGSSYVPTNRVVAGLDTIESWVSKKSERREQLLSVAEDLLPYLDEAVTSYHEYGPLYQSVLQLQRFMYAYGILHHLENQLAQYKRENDVMLISDAPLFLQNIIGKDDTPFIYEKIGSYFQHFLIDEFQDTSGLQWLNFRPLVENSLDSGHQNLVVGDVKQSIYRWRGGDWQLLLETIQQDVQDWRTQVQNLDRNYRSKRNIIAFNNTLFNTIPTALYDYITEEIQSLDNEELKNRLWQQSSVLKRAYEDVSQQLPDSYDHSADWQGHVRVEMIDEEYCLDEEGESIDWRSYVQQQLPVLVESLQDEGYSANDIAFLVRDRRDGQAIVDTFMQYKTEGKTKSGYNYEVVSSESLFLNTSLSVNLLVGLLRFLDNPSDAVTKSSITYKFRKLTQAELAADELHRIFRQENEDEDLTTFFEQLPINFQKYHPYLNKLPMYELVENLIQIFTLGNYSETAYVQAFQDLVLQYSLTERGDLHTFLAWWEEQGVRSSVQLSEEVNALRVMTIHKAKGLQFKVVILPFCDWSLDHHPFQTNVLWAHSQDSALTGMGLLPLKYSSQLTQTLFSQNYYEEKIRIHMDHLNLLYVAFTRAEEGLFAFARPTSTKKGNYPMTGIANLLRDVLPDLEIKEADALAGWDEMRQVYEVGAFPSRKPVAKAETGSGELTLQDYPSVRWRNRISVRPLSRGFLQSGTALGSVSQVALMQQLLIQLKAVGDLDAQIERLSFERGLTKPEQAVLQKQTRVFMDKPVVKDWYQVHGQVYFQRPLFLESGRGYLNLDRAMIEGDKITIINFFAPYDQEDKTRSLEKAKKQLLSHYSQLEAYLVDVTDLSFQPVV